MPSVPPSVPDHELIRVIGRGAYGEVWLARNLMGTHRAVKVVRLGESHTREALERDYRGVTLFEPVSRTHESLVDILQVGRLGEDGSFFYVMELADDVAAGQAIVPETYRPRTLREVLKQRARLPFAECLQLALSMASALDHLHGRGLFHRDVKPSNIVFVNGITKLADPGLVAESGDARSFVGTEGYIPPEGPGSKQADVFALGKVLYEASSGLGCRKFPEPRSGLETDPERDDLRELNEIVLKSCESDPKERYATAGKLHGDLVLLEGGESVRRLRGIERTWAKARVLLAVAGVLTVGGLAVQRIRLVGLEARAAEQQRALLIEGAEKLRPHEPVEHDLGWRTNAIELLRRAAAYRPDGTVRERLAATLAGLDARVNRARPLSSLAVAFEPGSSRLFVDTLTNGVLVWNLRGEDEPPLSTPGHGPFAFPSGGGPVQLVAEPDGGYALWNLAHGRRVNAVRPGGPSAKRIGVVTPDAALAAATFEAEGVGRIAAWNALAAEVVFQADRTASALALAPDGSLLAVGETNGVATVYSMPDGGKLATFSSRRLGITAMEFGWSPLTDTQGRTGHWLLAVGDEGGGVCLWEAARGVRGSDFLGSSGEVTALAFSPDGATIASAGREAIRLWDIASAGLLLRLPDADVVTDLEFSPDGLQLASSSLRPHQSPLTTVFDLEPEAGIQVLRGLQMPVHQVSFSRDNRYLAGLANDWRAAVWDARGRLIRLIEMPRGFMFDNCALAFTLDGTGLVFAAGTEAGLWEVQSGRRIGSWTLPPGLVDQLAITPDNKLLLFRVETTRAEVGPFSEFPPAQHPRVCRIRELLLPGILRQVAELTCFNGGVFTAAVAPDGSCFFVDGLHQVDERSSRFVGAFEASSGEGRWRMESSAGLSWGALFPDPTSTLLGARLGTDNQASWLDVHSGTRLERGRLGTLGSRGDLVVVGRSDRRGFTLFDQRGTRELLALAPDFEATLTAIFSPDGQRVAWGTRSGAVLALDLAEMNRRLSEIGLGW